MIPTDEAIPMSDAQEYHLAEIQDSFIKEVDSKYRAGVIEHGGNLWDHDLSYFAEELMKEAIDLYVYGYELRKKIRRLEIINP